VELLELLEKRINDTKSAIALYLVSGNCRSMEEYARATSKHNTLDEMLGEIQQIKKRYVEE
jgi:hypothetical protein